jgi:hypothetical protein
MDKKKGIIGGSETPVVTDKKVTTTPPTTSIGAIAPSQSEDKYNEQPPTPPQTMPAQPQPTQVAPTAPSLAAQPPGEEDEYNETPQAPPTTPAPAVTTTAPQYDDTDRRNQANLAAQTTTAPTANETMILQFDENNKPTLVKTDVATPKITPKTTDAAPSTTTPSTEGEEYHTYRDILAKLAPQTSDEDKKKQMRRERRKAIVSALGDGLSALSNLYFTTKGAPDQGLKPGMTDAAKKRMDDLRAQWQKEKDKYQDLMLKGLEMDREQGNWLKSYELQKNADKRAQKELSMKEEEWEKKKPMLEQELEKNKQELAKLERENNIGNATWKEEVALQKKKIAQQEREIEERNKPGNHGMTDAEKYQFDQKTSISRAANAETARHHRATEAAADKRNKQKGNNTLSSVNAGKTFHPNNQQVQDAYRYLTGRHFVEGKATTIQGMLNEIQNYMTTGRNRNAKSHGKNRVDDITGGPIVDTLLGGEWDNASDNEGAYDNF